jgi:hypothetical protein
MTASTSNPRKIFASRQQVTAALERYAKRARTIATQTGTQLVVSSTAIQKSAVQKAISQKPA